MGGPCDTLIPAAILYDNPGITLKEFSERLFRVASNANCIEIDAFMPFHEHAMAGILNLRHTQQYESELERQVDKELGYVKREFHHYSNLVVDHHNFDVLAEDVLVKTEHMDNNPQAHNKGDIILCDVNNYCFDLDFKTELPAGLLKKGTHLYVTEVLEATVEDYYTGMPPIEMFDANGEPIEDDISDKRIKQTLLAKLLHGEHRVEEFTSVKELSAKYPEYAPRAVYDFNQDTGQLYPGGYRCRALNTFRWNLRGEKYFLDLDALTKLSPNSVYARDAVGHYDGCAYGARDGWYHEGAKGVYSLSDLILTCEAIRRKRWDVLGYIGFRIGFLDFIYSDATTLGRYETAVFDSEMSVFAQKEGWTVFDFLREHATYRSKSQLMRIPFEERVAQYEQFKAEKAIADEIRRKEREVLQQEYEEEQKRARENGENPF